MNRLLAAILLAVAPVLQAAELIPPKQTIIVVGGGSDPTKLPLSGGTMTGDISMSTGTAINFLGSSSENLGRIAISSDPAAGGFSWEVTAGGLGASLITFIPVDGAPQMVLAFSTSAIIDVSNVAVIAWSPGDGSLVMNSNGPNQGTIDLSPAHGVLNVDGGSSVEVFPDSVTINASTLVNLTGTVNVANQFVTNGTVTHNSATSVNKALCLNSSNVLSVCTSGVTGSGACTCP